MADDEIPKPTSSRSSKRERKSHRDERSSRRHSEKHKSSRSMSLDDDNERLKHRSSHRHRRSSYDQESEDRESKRKALEMQGSIRPGGIAIGVIIGAESVGPNEEKAVSQRRKEHRSSTRQSASQEDRDRESTRRSMRSSKSLIRPGAMSSTGDDVAKSKRSSSTRSSTRSSTTRQSQRSKEAKNAAQSIRRSTGAESSTKDNSGKGKARRSANREDKIDVDDIGSNDGDNAFEIKAELVDHDEDEDEKINKKVNARLRKQMQAEEREQQQRMQEENERLRREMDEMQEKAEAQKKKKNKRNCIIVLVLLSLIGGGAGAYFAMQRSKTTTGAKPADTSPTEEATGQPTNSVVNSPSPTDLPSMSPTVFLKYPPLSPGDCSAVENLQPVTGQEDMPVMGYAIDMEAILSSDASPETIMPDIEAKLQSVLIPMLVGCADLNRRQLRGGGGGGGDLQVQRKLVNSLLYAVANGKVTVKISGDGVCENETSQPCYLIQVIVELSIKGPERIFDIMTLLLQLFQRSDLVEFLALNQPTQVLVMTKIESTDNTDPPSAAPTGVPSISPTKAPTSSPTTSPPTDTPSKNPTRAPVSGPTTDEPTPAPVPEATPSPNVTPLSPAPTCPGVRAYFDNGSFNQQSGGQDAIYNVRCNPNTDLVALVYNSDTCAVECVGFLSNADYSQSCLDNNQVRFILSGNFQNANVLVGHRSASNTVTCAAANMILLTDAPTPMPFPGSTPVPTITASETPTLFPTSAPTNPPTSLPTDAPTDTPTLSPTVATPDPTSQPTNAPTNVPTHDPTSDPTSSPTSSPTSAPTNNPTVATPAPTTRREYFETLLAGIPVNGYAMNWLIDNENWYPNTANPRVVEEVLERHDLIRLYQVTNGNSWTTKTNWMSSAHVCDWHGVSCDSDYFVTRLNLYSNNLSGIIPPGIGRLGNLIHLKMHSSDFGAANPSLPTELSLLTQLTYLNIHSSSLKGSIPDLVNMSNLEYLSLRQNNLSGRIPVLPHSFPSNDCSNCLLHQNNFGNTNNAMGKNCKIEWCLGGQSCMTSCV